MAASVVPPTVAVIIPAMNEEKSLPTTLQSVLAQKPSPQEIVVVDPGSTDRTSEVASECGAQVLTSPRGRAVQMNAGARNTKADVLLFLHADTGLPEGAVAAIQVAGAHECNVAGQSAWFLVIEGFSFGAVASKNWVATVNGLFWRM
ncbi:unnamed protein product [Durusdinium trenchii]|uniref:Glycosyltransferase 2-like domain-containing protein n=1 Tax=Durusdinium trenchii TaxID=1381693 RepID=A0ABP0JMH8_9DINO